MSKRTLRVTRIEEAIESLEEIRNINFLPLFTDMSIDVLEYILENEKHYLLLVRLLIRSEYLKDFSSEMCSICHSKIRKKRNNGMVAEIPVPEKEYERRSRQNGFSLMKKNTKDKNYKNTRTRYKFPIVWQCKMRKCGNRHSVTKESPIGLFRQTRDLGKLLKLIFAHLHNIPTCDQEKKYATSRNRVIQLRRALDRILQKVDLIDTGNSETNQLPLNMYYSQGQKKQISEEDLLKQNLQWKEYILDIRRKDGFYEHYGHEYAVELDQKMIQLNTTYTYRNKKIRMKENLWIFGCIERTIPIGKDMVYIKMNKTLNTLYFLNWLNDYTKTEIFNLPDIAQKNILKKLKHTEDLYMKEEADILSNDSNTIHAFNELKKLYINPSKDGSNFRKYQTMLKKYKLKAKRKNQHVRVGFMGRNLKSIMMTYITQWISDGSVIYTDADNKYTDLRDTIMVNGNSYKYIHHSINHSTGSSFSRKVVMGENHKIHSQSIERFWKQIEDLRRLRKKIHRCDLELIYNEAKMKYEYGKAFPNELFRFIKNSSEQIQYDYKNTSVILDFNKNVSTYSKYYPSIFDSNSKVKNKKTKIGKYSLNTFDNYDTWFIMKNWDKFKTIEHDKFTLDARITDVSNYDLYRKRRTLIDPSLQQIEFNPGFVDKMPHEYSLALIKKQTEYREREEIRDKYKIKKRRKLFKKINKEDRLPLDPDLYKLNNSETESSDSSDEDGDNKLDPRIKAMFVRRKKKIKNLKDEIEILKKKINDMQPYFDDYFSMKQKYENFLNSYKDNENNEIKELKEKI